MTGQPDFATITITYVPDASIVELKSLKLYLWSYRDEGVFHEDVTNRVLDDLVAAIAPRRMTVTHRLACPRWDPNHRGGEPSVTDELQIITEGLQFPEGPVALPGGDVLVCELKSGNLSRVKPDGSKSVVAHLGGSPNGAAIGPDGKVYVCNSGGWRWTDVAGMAIPGEHGVTAGGRLHRRAHPASRPRHRRVRGSLHRVRRPPAAGAE